VLGAQVLVEVQALRVREVLSPAQECYELPPEPLEAAP
jgi:hypothetical protein